MIEKIFTNLFSNAIKYASENGYVGVRIYPARQDQRPESAPPAAGTEYIAFTVTNTGAEIPDDKKEAIFESFNHLSDRRPQFESSSGLGLAIVKELVGNLNGTITLRSGNSKVAFTVVLPFTLNAEKTDSAAESYEYTVSEIDNLLTESDVMAPNDRHDRKACNIVVIEDDPNLRSYLEQRLSKHYNVYTAANGSEGIAKAERICPQIVITDLMMPEADGFEVCRRIRATNSRIGIIMLTARSQEMDKVTGLMTGADDYVTKPFSPAELTARVDALLRRAGDAPLVSAAVGEISQPPFLLNMTDRVVEKNGKRLKLTQLEYQIMKLFMENPDKALTREEILDTVWGRGYFGEVKIVDVNIRRLRLKIEDDAQEPRYIATVWGTGYKWSTD